MAHLLQLNIPLTLKTNNMTAVEWLISSIEEQIYRIKDNRIEISISEDDFNTLKK